MIVQLVEQRRVGIYKEGLRIGEDVQKNGGLSARELYTPRLHSRRLMWPRKNKNKQAVLIQ